MNRQDFMKLVAVSPLAILFGRRKQEDVIELANGSKISVSSSGIDGDPLVSYNYHHFAIHIVDEEWVGMAGYYDASTGIIS